MLNKKSEKPLLGAHLSIAKGFAHTIKEATSLGCTAVQFFSKSNRQWHAKPLAQEAINAFKQAVINSSIHTTIIHASYLINLGSSTELTHTKAIAALHEELLRAIELEVDYLVFHPGSYQNGSENDCINKISKGINSILNKITPSKTKLLLETSAGQGKNVGSSFEQLAAIYRNIEQKDRVGFCFDTCHVYAAGYDIATKEGYENTMNQFNALLSLENIHLFHVNDSKKGLNSRVDRHEHIGTGCLGLEPFRLIMNDARFTHIAKILETPHDHPDANSKNLHALNELLGT